MGKSNIQGKKRNLTVSQKKERLDKRFVNDENDYSIDYCWKAFIVNRMTRGNTKASLDAYKRFYKKLGASCVLLQNTTEEDITSLPIHMIDDDIFKATFIQSLKNKDGSPVSQQTINHYLRSYRAFGNFCENEGYISSGFSCPVKEVEPPIKEVYTEAELKRLLKEPSIEDFVAYRSYAIVTLILTTGARSNTILNIKVGDFDSETGYIVFNTTKAHNTIKEGLDAQCTTVLRKYVERWRSFENTKRTDYLFCSVYEEQMSRGTLCKSIKEYNLSRGVQKTSIHLLRHTFAKMWITSGGDIITLSKVLTHSELEMVKRYSNLYSTDVKAEVEQHSAISQLNPRRGKSIKNHT